MVPRYEGSTNGWSMDIESGLSPISSSARPFFENFYTALIETTANTLLFAVDRQVDDEGAALTDFA